MNKKRIISISICIIIGLIIQKNYCINTKEVSNLNSTISKSNDMIQCKYYDKIKFDKSVNLSTAYLFDVEFKGGIVSHHLLADNMIASFFKTVSIHQPEVIVVIAPNHTGAGVKDVYTSKWTWDTPYGTLNYDEKIVNYLIENSIAGTNFKLMENEHSISSLVPYIKYFMPETKIVPILMSGTNSKAQSIRLGKLLKNEICDRDFMVIGSVDFSHYLSVREADEKDEITKQALKNRDINQISWMCNDYLDSPSSIVTFLTIMNEIGANNDAILAHDNSARISGRDKNNTTSYFTMVYW